MFYSVPYNHIAPSTESIVEKSRYSFITPSNSRDFEEKKLRLSHAASVNISVRFTN